MAKRPQQPVEDGSEYYAVYKDHATTLRAWFLTLGAGGPGFLITNAFVSEHLKAAGTYSFVLICFFLGIVLQIIVVAVNKNIAWASYRVFSAQGGEPRTRWTKLAVTMSEWYWVDIAADALSALFFSIAVMIIFLAMV